MERNKFFGSKFNTALLLILIVLMFVAIYIMLQNKQIYFSEFAQDKTEQIKSINEPEQNNQNPEFPLFENYKVAYSQDFIHAKGFYVYPELDGSGVYERVGDRAFTVDPNFAGYYSYTVVSCGTECGSPVMYDQRTGKGVSLGLAVDDGNSDVLIQRDSKLFVNIIRTKGYNEYTQHEPVQFKYKDAKVVWSVLDTERNEMHQIKTLYCDLKNIDGVISSYSDLQGCVQ